MARKKNPSLPTSSFAHLNDTLDAAFADLHLPSQNSIAFRRLAEDHISRTIPAEALHNIWHDLDFLETQATIAYDRFLLLHGEKLWETTYADLQSKPAFQRLVRRYFVCLLQIPTKAEENELLREVLLPVEERPRSFSVPRGSCEAKAEWSRERERESDAAERDEEVEEQMARITIGDDSAFENGESEEASPERSMEDSCSVYPCVIDGCDEVFSDAAAVSDHFDQAHPL